MKGTITVVVHADDGRTIHYIIDREPDANEGPTEAEPSPAAPAR